MTAISTDIANQTGSAETNAAKGEMVAWLIALGLIGYIAGSTALFGAVGLAMAALSLVPVIYLVLLIITVGK